MRNILVTGANGQLGNELRLIVKGCTSGDRYFFTDIADTNSETIEMLHKLGGSEVDIRTDRLDITDLFAIKKFINDHKISCIINCAAYTNVDAAESNEKLAESLNAKAVENLALAMKEVDGLLVHISTDYVYGGDSYNTPIRENQKGTPTGIYGLTKLHGEQAIKEMGCKNVIIRTAWLYSEFGKNFVKTMLNLTSIKPQLNVVFDQTGTPTYAYDLAEAIFKLVDERKAFVNEGIYHYSNEGVCSWYDFTILITRLAGNLSCDIQPCHSDEFPSPVIRPAYSVLDKTKVKETFGLQIPYWVDSLKVCINNLTR